MNNYRSVKDMNRHVVYQMIYHNQKISKQEVALRTGLSLPTVTQNLEKLEKLGFIRQDGYFESTGGRKAKAITIVQDARYSVGVDITKNHLTLVLLDLMNNIVSSVVREKFRYCDEEEYYDALGEKIHQFLEGNDVDEKKILGVGIALPCIVNSSENKIINSFENSSITARVIDAPANIYDKIRRRLAYPTKIFNDANAAGFAEFWGVESDGMLAYISLSNSVGGAIIDKSMIYHGSNYRSAEFGHMRLNPKGRKCYCGQKGCVDVYCAATVLSDHTDGNLELFFRKLSEGDSRAREVFDKYVQNLAGALINIRMTFDSDIVLGGYVGTYLEEWMPEIRRTVELRNPFEREADYLLPCRLKKEAAAVGAGLYFIDDFVESI